jgi:hypothetical protein
LNPKTLTPWRIAALDATHASTATRNAVSIPALERVAHALAELLASSLSGVLDATTYQSLRSALAGTLATHPGIAPLVGAIADRMPASTGRVDVPAVVQTSVDDVTSRIVSEAARESYDAYLLGMPTAQAAAQPLAAVRRLGFGAVAAFLTGAVVGAVLCTAAGHDALALRRACNMFDDRVLALNPKTRSEIERVSMRLCTERIAQSSERVQADVAWRHFEVMGDLGCTLAARWMASELLLECHGFR